MLKIIDVNGELKPDILSKVIEEYKTANAGVVVNASFEIVSPDILSNVLTSTFDGCDVYCDAFFIEF